MASSGRHPVELGDRETWTRLGQLLIARRGQLGYKNLPPFWRERVERRGFGESLSERTMRDIENDARAKPGRFLPATLSLIATIYEVRLESMLAVAAGQADQLVPAEPAAAAAPPPRGELPGWMTREEEQSLRPYADDIWERLVEAGRDASGGELFGEGTPDAADWDAWKARGVWSLREMVAMAAEVRRRTDTRDGRNSAPAS